MCGAFGKSYKLHLLCVMASTRRTHSFDIDRSAMKKDESCSEQVETFDDADKIASTTPKTEELDASHAIVAGQYMTLWQTVRTFPLCSLLCFAAMLSALSDGFQFTLPGNIIASKGFIRQFGSEQADGSYKLDPHYVSLWGGELLLPVAVLD